MSIDPRIAARRAEVREVAARADARRTLWWLLAVVVLALLVWIAQGPLFSVQHLSVTGAERSDPPPGLAAGGIEVGSPLVLIRAVEAAEALAADPWILDADITVTFPDRVAVAIVERRPALQVRTPNGEFVVAVDGVVVAHGGLADDTLAVTDLDSARVPPVGGRADDTVRGLAEFVAALPADVALAGELHDREGELWFDIHGVSARLGRPVEMATKATVLASLLDDGMPEGSVVHLVAPLRPSVLAPEPSDDAEGDSEGVDTDETGAVDGDDESTGDTSGGA